MTKQEKFLTDSCYMHLAVAAARVVFISAPWRWGSHAWNEKKVGQSLNRELVAPCTSFPINAIDILKLNGYRALVNCQGLRYVPDL